MTANGVGQSASVKAIIQRNVASYKGYIATCNVRSVKRSRLSGVQLRKMTNRGPSYQFLLK